MSQWTISRVLLRTPQLYYVVDERGCAPQIHSTSLWDSASGTQTQVINAVTEEKGITLQVSLAGRENVADENSTKYAASDEDTLIPTPQDLVEKRRRGFILEVYAAGSNGEKDLITSTTSICGSNFSKQGMPELSLQSSNLDLKSLVSLRKSGEPWAFCRNLSFRLVIVSTPGSDVTEGQNLVSRAYEIQEVCPIELYAICPEIPSFLRYEGIPLHLLRFALGPQHQLAAAEPKDWSYLKAITHRVFESGYIYDRNGGNYSFTAGAGRTTQLTKFLRIWSIITGQADSTSLESFGRHFKENTPTVNCMDQTGILGVCMSFACVDEDDRKTLGAYFIKPFGFLHGSPLVGFPRDEAGLPILCNNPYSHTFVSKLPLVLEPTDENRSYFSNHVFLEFREQIYDSCAGPYIGCETSDAGNLKAYLTATIDAVSGAYPTTFLGAKNERVTNPDMSKYIAKPDGHELELIADQHGGILGEIHNLQLDGNKWWDLPKELNHDLDLKDFALDTLTFGDLLKAATQKGDQLWDEAGQDFKACKVTDVSPPDVSTGAILINKSAADHGDFVWALKAGDDAALLTLRIHPTFDDAAAGRSLMYDHGGWKDGPSKKSLSRYRYVTGEREGIAHATALAGKWSIDCQSKTLNSNKLRYVVGKALEVAMIKADSVIVGNKLADNGGHEDPEDSSRHHLIKVKLYDSTSYAVQVKHCLDIDWSLSDENTVVLDYKTGTLAEFKKGGYNIVQDEDEPEMEEAYLFHFYARNSGESTVRLCFYDRYFNPTYRVLDFEIAE